MIVSELFMAGRNATLIVPDADMPVETAIHDAARKNGGEGDDDQMDLNKSHSLRASRCGTSYRERHSATGLRVELKLVISTRGG